MYDICIVGAGAVGISMAHRLRGVTKKDGTLLQVVVLESGVRNVRDESVSRSARHAYDPLINLPADVKTSDLRTEKHWTDPIVAPMDLGETNAFVEEARPEGFLTASRSRTFGGSTNCWGGYIRPLDDHDFAGWPNTINRRSLFACYSDALKLVGLAHHDWFDDPAAWIRSRETSRTIAMLDSDKLSAAGLRTVIIQQQNDPSIHDFQMQFGWVFTEFENITLIRNATALNLSTAYQHYDPKRSTFMATGVTCGSLIDKNTLGQRFQISAARYVLAMGGLEIPRFLLNCIDGSYGLTELLARGLGKYYMNHPKLSSCAWANVTFPTDAFGPDAQAFYGGTTLRNTPSATVYAYVTPTDTGMRDNTTNNFRVAIGLDGARFNCELNFEQEPNDKSAVTLSLDPTYVDVFGKRQLRLDWEFTEQDATTVCKSMDMMKSMVVSLGGKIDGEWHATGWDFNSRKYPPLAGIYTGDHHMGTCRMRSADEADDGVVDSHCKASQFMNLWLCSTGVFRRGGWANSTYTLLALALRLADELQSV